jgi:hypothetical protein
MTTITRTAIVLAMFVSGLAATACDDRESIAGPTMIASTSQNGGVLPVVTVGRLSGQFTLTLTADAACDSLPNELRTRTSGATFTVNSYWHAAETRSGRAPGHRHQHFMCPGVAGKSEPDFRAVS